MAKNMQIQDLQALSPAKQICVREELKLKNELLSEGHEALSVKETLRPRKVNWLGWVGG